MATNRRKMMNKRNEYEPLSAKLRRKILEQIDLRRLRSTNSATAQEEVLALIRGSINSEVVSLSFAERESLVREILDEVICNAKNAYCQTANI